LPQTDDLEFELTTAAMLMVVGFGAVDQLCNLSLHADLKLFDKEVRTLMEGPPAGTTE
jgi:hypothetical protein